MSLKGAINWANKQASRYLTYHVVLWNSGYSTITEQQLKRYKKDAKSVYNTKDRVINWDLVPNSNTFLALNDDVKQDILMSKVKIEPTFICNMEFPIGPKLGTILKPFYHSRYKVTYRFKNIGGGDTEMTKIRMERLCVYFKEYVKDFNDPSFTIDKKEPVVKSRFGRLFSMSK
ncbi:MAG: hypothetical protein SLAVMIC_00413 [uncultured marine phage]|uniref:Uncharacterized protein n=1 Tax=uncultured marine phage TaxID=707152 RepID=A0A8D9CD04_9VIRU|nr:MAG: hypothetical protein SLAVMIC_00413 [uncultured marine phage]